jgi:hypothetical protein
MNNNGVTSRFAPSFGDEEGIASVLPTNQTTTMTDYPDYRWNDDPDNGEYELQFDRFEPTTETYRGSVVFLIVDTDKDLREEERIIGNVTYRTETVPEIDPDEPATTRIFHATIKDSKIVEMTYKPEISEQRHEEAKKRYNRLTGKTEDEGYTEN